MRVETSQSNGFAPHVLTILESGMPKLDKIGAFWIIPEFTCIYLICHLSLRLSLHVTLLGKSPVTCSRPSTWLCSPKGATGWLLMQVWFGCSKMFQEQSQQSQVITQRSNDLKRGHRQCAWGWLKANKLVRGWAMLSRLIVQTLDPEIEYWSGDAGKSSDPRNYVEYVDICCNRLLQYCWCLRSRPGEPSGFRKFLCSFLGVLRSRRSMRSWFYKILLGKSSCSVPWIHLAWQVWPRAISDGIEQKYVYLTISHNQGWRFWAFAC